MKLKADFCLDWANILNSELINDLGYDTSGIEIKDIPYEYNNLMRRRISEKKRNVVFADTFVCPPDLIKGWEKLEKSILNGEDLKPYLSKKITDLSENDPILNDWNVHHFHLGDKLDKSHKFIIRTGSLLFALVTETTIYVIGIFAHGDWAKEDIIETIHRNWPELMEPYKLDAMIMDNDLPTEEQRLQLRDGGVNLFTTLKDGSIYMPIGGGINTAGGGMHDTFDADCTYRNLKKLEETIKTYLEEHIDELKGKGYKGEKEIEARFEREDEKDRVYLPKYDYSIELTRTDNNF